MNDYIMCVRNIISNKSIVNLMSNSLGEKEDRKFGDEPSESIHFLTVPKGWDIAVDFKQEDSISWFKRVIADMETFEDENGVKHGNILLHIHGYNTDQKKLIKKHRQLKKSLKDKFKGIVVSFDWPSKGDPFNYKEDQEDAAESALFIINGLKELTTFNKIYADYNIKIHLLAHSTGAYIVKEAFKDANEFWNVDQIIFIGADIPASSKEPFAFYRYCNRVTNYYSSYDWALTFSEVIEWFSDLIYPYKDSRRAGKDGLDLDSSPNIVNIDCSDYFDKSYTPKKQKQRMNDDNEVIGSVSHSWYIGDDLFTQDMYLTMMNSDNYFDDTRKITPIRRKFILNTSKV